MWQQPLLLRLATPTNNGSLATSSDNTRAIEAMQVRICVPVRMILKQAKIPNQHAVSFVIKTCKVQDKDHPFMLEDLHACQGETNIDLQQKRIILWQTHLYSSTSY
jgi:hypothetical protein